MDSWRRISPEYELIEINEDNFDIESYKYTKQAYEQKKFAFCSDVARMHWLYNIGGISVDADVECVRSFTEDILSQRAFTSKESTGRLISAVIASEANHPWVWKILKYYRQNNFIYDPRNVCNTTIIHDINQKWYKETKRDIIYLHEGVAIYPADWLEANNWATGKKNITDNTFTVHHYTASWVK